MTGKTRFAAGILAVSLGAAPLCPCGRPFDSRKDCGGGFDGEDADALGISR